MYQLVQFVRHRMPFVWQMVDNINAMVFGMRYGRGLKGVDECCAKASDSAMRFVQLGMEDIPALVEFFKRQPEKQFEFFHPHPFDEKSLKGLIKNRSFIMLGAYSSEELVGYAFIRCFMNGKSFRGKMVDVGHQGRGIAKRFGILTTEIAGKIGIGLFGTISKANVASMNSSKASNRIKVIEELPDDFLLIQYLPIKENGD